MHHRTYWFRRILPTCIFFIVATRAMLHWTYWLRLSYGGFPAVKTSMFTLMPHHLDSAVSLILLTWQVLPLRTYGQGYELHHIFRSSVAQLFYCIDSGSLQTIVRTNRKLQFVDVHLKYFLFFIVLFFYHDLSGLGIFRKVNKKDSDARLIPLQQD